jgi:putative transposase
VKISLAHKIELKPNNIQKGYFARACGTARFVWNWGLAEWSRQYAEGLKPSGLGLKKEFNLIKKEEFPWILEVLRDANSQPFSNLQKAFNSFFKGISKYPTFKKKGISDSFYIANDKFKVEGKAVSIPKLGWVKMTECLGYSGKILSATVSRAADKWFVSFNVQMSITPSTCENQAVVGVDLGIKTLATLSNGEMVQGPKALRKMQKKLKRLQQSLSKKEKGSKNREKQKRKVARLYYKISCIRLDSLHKLTSKLVLNHSVIVIEDLNVSGMMANHKLARAISDMGFYEFRRQLSYKALTAGVHVVIADRWFPSSKRCSSCGAKHQNLMLSDRTFICPTCSFNIDRDLNAAKNLEMYPQLMAA